MTSIFTVAVSAVHPEHTISNALIMSEDIEYDVKLDAFQQMNI